MKVLQKVLGGGLLFWLVLYLENTRMQTFVKTEHTWWCQCLLHVEIAYHVWLHSVSRNKRLRVRIKIRLWCESLVLSTPQYSAGTWSMTDGSVEYWEQRGETKYEMRRWHRTGLNTWSRTENMGTSRYGKEGALAALPLWKRSNCFCAVVLTAKRSVYTNCVCIIFITCHRLLGALPQTSTWAHSLDPTGGISSPYP